MIEIEKEWAAVQNDRVLLIRDTKTEAEEAAKDCPTDAYEIVALPKSNGGVFL